MTAEAIDYNDGDQVVAHHHYSSSRHAVRAGRRQRALAAATEVFVSRGYHTATMAEIAQHAGWSKPILYKQFSGKLELYLAVLDQHIETLTRSVEHALRSTATNRGRLHAAVQAYFDFVDSESQGFRLVFESDITSEPSVRWRVGRASDDCVHAVMEAVAADSAMSLGQAHVLAAGLVGASQFGAKYWLETGRGIAKAEAVAAIVTLCWGGLARIPVHSHAHDDVSAQDGAAQPSR